MSADSTDGDGGTTEIDLFSFMFYAVLFLLISNRLLSIGNALLEEKIHVFKELDSPALSLWFALQSSREAEQRRLYNILS